MSSSRKRKLRRSHPPAQRIAAAYECGHCRSTTSITTSHGISTLTVAHDGCCLVLAGRLPWTPDLLRAIGGAESGGE